MKPTPELTCREVEERVTAYLDGALPQGERAQLEAHLERCADCTTHVDQMRLTVASLGRLRSATGESSSADAARAVELFHTHGLHRPGPRVRDVPLGLGNDLAALGDHIAYLWETETEFEAIAGFLEAGVARGEACILVGHDAPHERLMAGLERRGLNLGALVDERRLQLAAVGSSADALLGEFDERLKDAVDRGMPAVRVVGNLNWGRGAPGWPADREIWRIEACVTAALERLPGIVVCAYDVTHLPEEFLGKGGMECHPLTLQREGLRHNGLHVPTERFLAELAAD